jgi:uncharacterized protein YyaL (SSP411 family)
MLWLARAQDATSDDGVSQGYFIKDRRWAASYPETTGYIIPTFFDYATKTTEIEYFERAVRMARWEQEIQLPYGAIQASTIDAKDVVPTIFNTGMVIFGWMRAYAECGDASLLGSAVRASEWLTSVQDADGAWRKYGSSVTATPLNTYNTRVAWALLTVHQVTRNDVFLNAAIRNLNWALTQQLANGWLENNCLLDNSQPYTHTIAYAMRGFLEAGAYLNERKYIEAAEGMFRPLRAHISRNGFLPGRFDREWKPTVRYCCLTGNSQLALNAFRLYSITHNSEYVTAGERLLHFVLRTRNTRSQDPNVRGAIAGSYPVGGKYHPHQYPNWAAKFTADAIMLLEECKRTMRR